MSTYNIAWKFTASCVENADVIQYQIQFVEDCLTRRIVTVSTGSNKTTALIVIPSCTDESCYVRVRAELSDTSFTDYSPCVRINNSLMEYESKINNRK